MCHALNVGAGFRVAELGRACEAGDRFALSAVDFLGRPQDLRGERMGAVAGSQVGPSQGQHVAHPGLEFMTIDRLVQKIGRSALQGVVAGLLFVVCGDHQDREIVCEAVGPEAADELDAVDLRHHVIDDEKIRIVAEAPLQAFARIAETDCRAVVDLVHQRLHQREVQRGVIDNHYLHFLGRLGLTAVSTSMLTAPWWRD